MIATAREFGRLLSLRLLAATAALAVLESALVVPIGLLFQRVFDHSIPRGDKTELVVIGALLIVLAVGAAGVALWTRHLVLATTKEAVRKLSAALLDRLAQLPLGWIDRQDAAYLHAVVVQDSERIDRTLNAVAAEILPALILGFALGVAMLVVEPLLTLLMVPVIPVMVVVTRAIERALARRTRAWQRAFDRFSMRTHFLLRARPLITASGTEDAELTAADRELRELARSGRAMTWLSAAYFESGSVITMIAAVVVLMVGGVAVIDGRTSLGSLLAFFALAALQRGYIARIAIAVPQVISGGEYLARVRIVLEAEEPQPYVGKRPPSALLPILLREVHFAYESSRPVLRGASMDLGPGELVAIIGPNGAGKTTIANLILGFYRPAGGSLLAAGTPFDTLDVRALRHQMAAVAQAPVLFSGTVADNIGYGAPGAARASIVEAARRVDADEFISKLRLGYDSPIGDEGALLSGGQRQRIAIARALIRSPELLILDEPTASLDRESAGHLLRTLRESLSDRTVLVISHDPEVTSVADRVYSLTDGVLTLETARPAVPRPAAAHTP